MIRLYKLIKRQNIMILMILSFIHVVMNMTAQTLSCPEFHQKILLEWFCHGLKTR